MKSFIKSLLTANRASSRSALIEKKQVDLTCSDRRKLAYGISMWDEKDPRADRSFFTSGLPSIVLSNNQTIIDWNIAFELAFSELKGLKRGATVNQWYESLDNFKSIPKRQDKLFGDRLLPVADRNRVVFKSNQFGRMVFTKIMNPIIDQLSGRIVGWTIVLNINSISKRNEFFEALFDAIERETNSKRHVLGVHAVVNKSLKFKQWLKSSLSGCSFEGRTLVIGGLYAPYVVSQILEKNPLAKIDIVDSDSETLRACRHKISRLDRQVKLHRMNPEKMQQELDSVKFDQIIVANPDNTSDDKTMREIRLASQPETILVDLKYTESNPADWWQLIKNEVETKGELDLLKWHWDQIMFTKTA